METPDERLAEGDGGLLPPVNAASRKVLRYVNSELVLSKDHGTFQVNEKMALRINGQIYTNPRILCGRCRRFPHDPSELIMSMGLHVLSGRKDGNVHRLSSAAAGTEMCSMDEGIGVPSQRRVHAFPWIHPKLHQNANFVP